MTSHGRLHTSLMYRATSGSGRSSIQGELETHEHTVLGRRRKSPSPDTRVRVSDGKADVSKTAKKKVSTSRNSNGDASARADTSLIIDIGLIDRGRKQKSKTAIVTQSRMAVENAGSSTTHQRASQTSGGKDRDRSQSRDGQSHSRKAPHTHTETTLTVMGKRDSKFWSEPQPERICASITAAEMQRMQEKIDFLKKCLHDNKKLVKKQQKTIENLEKQLQIEAKIVSDKDDEMQRLKSKLNKNEELISNIEVNMQCQVCMDLLHKPYALPPCGHIMCMQCLQGWFRQAPVDEDEMYDDDPEYLMNRRKTCPCCRTVVRSRPIPAFLVKTIATSLMKARPQLHISSLQQSNASPLVDEDPWEDLFPQSDGYDDSYDEDDQTDDDEDDEDAEDLEDDDEGYDDERDSDGDFGYSSASDDEPLFVRAQWEPPDLHIPPEDHNVSVEQLSMLRRGATKEMIARFHMEYTHTGGLVAVVSGPGDKRSFIFLGWNITLSPDDKTGQEYINGVLNDMVLRPERWHINEVNSRKQEVTALIPAKDVREFVTTDTEAWTDDEAEDLD